MCIRDSSGTTGGRDPRARALRSAGLGSRRQRTAGVPACLLADAETAYAGEARHHGAHFPGRLLDRALDGASRRFAADGVRYRGARMARLRRVQLARRMALLAGEPAAACRGLAAAVRPARVDARGKRLY